MNIFIKTEQTLNKLNKKSFLRGVEVNSNNSTPPTANASTSLTSIAETTPPLDEKAEDIKKVFIY
jgi:hypothetical protein